MPKLDVPGARLHHDVTGSGPLLLLIPGGPADSGVFAALVPVLASTHTVLTYDPRGLASSSVDDPTAPVSVATQAEDARALLTEVGGGPALVFGSSGGALTAVELLTRHPEVVRGVVAHEPPLGEFMPPGTREQGAEIDRAFREHGAFAALQVFMGGAGLGEPGENGPGGGEAPDPAATDGMRRNLEMFFGAMMAAIGDYVPDRETLRAARGKLVVAAGETSAGQPAHDSALSFADAVDAPLVTVPGDHGGFHAHPAEFADRLRRVLADFA